MGKDVLSATILFILCFLSGAYPIVDAAEEGRGEVKPKVTMRATVPNRKEDYQLSIVSIPREEVLPGQIITYTVFYGCSGWNETSGLRLVVTWNFPEGRVGEYVPGSASDAFGHVSPDVEPSENKISWWIRKFPPRVTSQKVSFRLRTNPQFRRAGTFPIEVRAELIAPGIAKEAISVLRITYPKEKVVEAPLLIWRYLREVFRGPEFRFVVEESSVLLLVLIAVLFFLAFLARKDIGIGSLFYLFLFLWRRFLEIVGLRRGRPVWGVVRSLDSGEPVFLAKVFLYDFSGRPLSMELTNQAGEFGFWFEEGNYLAEVKKPGFEVRAGSENCLILNAKRFVFIWENKEQEIFLQREVFLRGLLERVFEVVTSEFLDFLVISGVILGCLNFCFQISLSSAILVALYFLFFSLWFFGAGIR